MFWLRLQAILLTLFLAIGCSRFGVDSLIDESALSTAGNSISASLASNLKADMVAAGVDATSASLIANEAVSLSSSLEGSIMMAYSISSQEIQANATLYQQVSEKFIEGAMAGIAQTSLSDDLKVAAAGVNSYTPIRTMAETASAGMSEADKQAAVEAISAKAVAKLQSTGIDSSKLAAALTKISEKAVEGVSKSGVSATAAREMVKKAAGGATKGLSEMGVSAAEVQNLVSAVASGATKGLSSFSANGDTAATDLLADVTSGLSTGLAAVQEEVAGFDMYTALSAAESSITSEATTTLSLDSSAISTAVSSGQQTVSLPSPAPIAKNNDTNAILTASSTIPHGGSVNVALVAEDNTGAKATICYTTDGANPTCTSTDSSATCTAGTAYASSPISVNSNSTVKAIACMAGKTSSPERSYAFQLSVGAPAFSVGAGALTYSNNTITIANHAGFGSATTCYTRDGSTPACAINSGTATCSTGTAYTTGITISEATTLKAISCQDGYGASSVTSAAYTYQLSAPTFTQSSSMQISSPDSGVTLCYTSDGSSPTCNSSGLCTNGTTYTAPFSFSSSINYKALSCKENAVSSSVKASNLYEFSGVLTNVAISSLAGWTQCYVKAYSTSDAVSNLKTSCNKGKVLLACRATGSSTLTVAANATWAQVFQDTGNGSSSTHNANNVQWYFSDTYSMGFAPVGATVSRGSCDTGGGNPPTDTNRMCWHTGGGNLTSGWSCGNSNNSSLLERIAFHAD